MVVVTLACRGHAAATKFEYSFSPGFLGKGTTQVMTPLPLCVGSGAARLDDVCLLLPGEGILDLSEERTEGGSELEHRSNVEVPTHPS